MVAPSHMAHPCVRFKAGAAAWRLRSDCIRPTGCGCLVGEKARHTSTREPQGSYGSSIDICDQARSARDRIKGYSELS